MEILEGGALYRTLLERYSKNPLGWSFVVSPSPTHGFYDARVGGPEESWHLKLDTIFKPSPFVLGTKSNEETPGDSPSPVSFGFRKVGREETLSLLDGSADGMSRLLGYLSSVNPVAPTSTGSYLQGPYIYSKRPQAPGSSMTREQQRIDTRLSDEMLKLVRRRYPSYL